MVKITNGVKVFEVTKGAFENFYRKNGFVPFVEETATDLAGAPQPPVKTDDELFLEMIVPKPLAQWSKKEMTRYAELVGLDPKDKDLREAIKERLQETGGRSKEGADERP